MLLALRRPATTTILRSRLGGVGTTISVAATLAVPTAGASVGAALGLGCFGVGGVQSVLVRWATKKAAGSSSNRKDAPGKRLGIKERGGEWVEPGYIIARQRGTKWHPGMNVKMGRDHTICALIPGHVRFTHTERPWRTSSERYRTWISVVPHNQDPAILRAWFDANQSRYLRIISDKYHKVPRSVWAPRERLIQRLQRSALLHAEAVDEARRDAAEARVTMVATGSTDPAVPSAIAVPLLPMPLRPHTTVTRVLSAHAILGERKAKTQPAVRHSKLRTTTSLTPVPSLPAV